MSTTHITLDLLERASHANSLFFPHQNLVVSFDSREEANEAVDNAAMACVAVIPLYGPEGKHGA